jgi:uncharacterized protein (DUF2147 family)
MKRLGFLAMLIALTTSADARSISFRIGSHQVHIERQRHCRSMSCTSMSISRSLDWRRKRFDDERTGGVAPRPVPPAPQTVLPPKPPVPSAPPATAPAKTIVTALPPPAVYTPAASASEIVAAPPPPPLAGPPAQQVSIPAPPPPPEAKPAEAAQPAPQIEQVSHRSEEEPQDSPIGDWLTEGRGMVRIAECGRSLCGYAIKEGDDEKGEAVLINMKSKSDQQWGGSVYSKDSGDTYYGTMRLKGPNMLRVEACAFGRFYCNGNNWTRISSKPLVTSRHVSEGPRT